MDSPMLKRPHNLDPPLAAPSANSNRPTQRQKISHETLGPTSRPFKKSICLRLSRIPLHWGPTEVRAAIQSSLSLSDPDIFHIRLRIYISGTGGSKTALLDVPASPSTEGRARVPYLPEMNFTYDGFNLCLDSHFHGLTPLNEPGTVTAE